MFFCHVLNRANWKFNYTLCNYVTRIYIVSCVVDKAYFLVYIHTSTLRRVMHRNQMVKLLANECSGFNPGSSSFPLQLHVLLAYPIVSTQRGSRLWFASKCCNRPFRPWNSIGYSSMTNEEENRIVPISLPIFILVLAFVTQYYFLHEKRSERLILIYWKVYHIKVYKIKGDIQSKIDSTWIDLRSIQDHFEKVFTLV